MTTVERTRPSLSELPRWGDYIVPWIAQWTGDWRPNDQEFAEGGLHAALLETPDGREHVWAIVAPGFFRDDLGWLWYPHRDPDEPRTGKPQFALLHTGRARAAMRDNICQVCGGPATDERGRIYFTVPSPDVRRGEPIRTAHAPVCPRCTPIALAQCPELKRKPWTPVRCSRVEVIGGIGDVYEEPRPDGKGGWRASGEIEAKMIPLASTDPRAGRMLTKQHYIALHGWEKV